MAHTTRILVAGIVMVGALVSAKHSEAAQPQDNAAAARPLIGSTAAGVRTTSPVLATLIRQATERSATFRGLIDTIEASRRYRPCQRGQVQTRCAGLPAADGDGRRTVPDPVHIRTHRHQEGGLGLHGIDRT